MPRHPSPVAVNESREQRIEAIMKELRPKIDATVRQMVERAGAKVVGCGFVIELARLGGAARIAPHEAFSLMKFE